jgi:hypothetical protein
MRAKIRRTIDMGERVASYGHASPVQNASWLALLAQVDDLLERAKISAAAQREGIAQVRGATALRTALQAEIRGILLAHIARVADQAAGEQPEIRPSLRIGHESRTVRGFRTTASAIVASAQTHRVLLVKHGLSEDVLPRVVTKLDQFDQAVMQGVEGRRQHVAATAELQIIADELSDVVKVMNGFERLRFAEDPERLAAWTSASSVTAAPVAREEAPAEGPPEGGRPSGGDVRPAA